MKLFVFLIQRKRDSEPWATVFTDKAMAERYKDRVSRVVEIEVSKDENTNQAGPGPGNGANDGNAPPSLEETRRQ